MTLGWANPAGAQVAASASLTSDYQYRGLSLSDGEPAASVSLSYERDAGGYAGGTVLVRAAARPGSEILAHVEYVGYAWRVGKNQTWDLGVTNLVVFDAYGGKSAARDTEAYAGISRNNLKLYIYYSPSYFGEDQGVVYADLGGGFRPARHWRIFGHVGVLTRLRGSDPSYGPREQYDARAGVAADVGRAEVQLAWTIAVHEADYAVGQPQRHPSLVLGATWFF